MNNTAKAVFLTVIMVLSLPAMGAAGFAASDGVSSESESDDGPVLSELSEETGEIDEELLRDLGDGPTEAVVRLTEADNEALATGDREQVIGQLKTHASATQGSVIEQAEDLGAPVLNELWITNAILVEIESERQLEALADVVGVERIHPNYEYEIPDVDVEDADIAPDQDYTYGLEQINAPDVWDDFGTKGEGASVAVLDGGYDNDHQDLPEIHPDDQWQEWDGDGNPVESDPRSTSSVDHGVHVSGTIVGADDPDGDVPGFGVAPEATLYNGLVLPGGGGTFTQVAAGMEWAVDNWGVDIINMSLGGGPGDDALLPAAEHIWQAGSILVASNGNNQVGAPGTYWSSFGSQAVDENEDPASFADEEFIDDPDAFFGTDVPDHWPDEYQTPHASAAGVGVLSAQDGDGYDTLSGTSMSAPHHAGMFALMVSHAGETALEDMRQIALDTAQEPPGGDDPIFGEGISDAHAALEEVGPAVPEFDVGDVTESGDRGPGDALAIQMHLAGMEPEPFNENLADVTGDGEIGPADSLLLRQFLVGQVDDGETEVSNLEAPDSVEGGDEITVNADLENIGDLRTIQGIEFQVAESDDFENVLFNETVHVADLAPDGENSTESIEFDIDTTGLPGGDYAHGVFSDDDSATDEITITEPFFSVEELDAPEEADSGDEIEVETTVENIGNQNDTQDVFFRFDPDGDFDDPLVELPLAEDLELTPGESETLTANVSLDGLEDGTFEHGVFTDDDQTTADIKINRWFFDVSDVAGPDEVEHGEEIEVSATVENIGNATDTQEIEYTLGAGGAGEDVAIVSPAASTTGYADALEDILTDNLGEEFTIEQIDSEELLDEMDNYDTFAVLRFGEEDGDSAGDDRASDFYNELGDTQGAIYFDTETGASDEEYANAINRLHSVEGIVDTYDDAHAVDGQPIEITSDHEIFTGIGDVGDTFEPVDSGFDDYSSSWTGYDGDRVGDAHTVAEGAVGVGDNGLEVLVTNAAPNFFASEPADFTEEGQQLMSNAVELVATGQVEDDAAVDDTETVELDPGEATDVTLSFTPTADDGVGDLAHVVSSEDDTDTAPVTVTSPEQVDITDLRAPAEAQQGDEIEVEADLEHMGSETTTQDVDFLFAGAVEDTEEVTLDPGETDTVSFDVEIPVELEPGAYEHGVEVDFDDEFAQIEVLEADPANFAVDNLDAPIQVGQGETFNVSATVENIGDLEATQTIEYEFDVDDDDEAELEDVDVAVVDDDLDTDALEQELEARGFTEEAIEEYLREVDPQDMNPRAGFIADQLDDDVFTVHNVSSEDLLDNTDMDVYVISSFDADGDIHDFLDETSEDTGVVYMDSWSSFSTDALNVLVDEIGDPEATDNALAGDGDVMLEITEDHALFEGVADAGETILHMDGDIGSQDRRWFEGDYSGDAIADIEMDGEVDGAGVGVNPEKNEVILASHASWSTSFTPHEAFSEESNQIMLNAVEYAAEEALLDGAAEAGSDDITALDGSTELTLGAGESAEVEFEFTVPDNQPPIEYEHGVFSEDDEATDDIVVLERSSDIVVTGHFPEDDSVVVGEEITTEAVVVNEGEAPGEREIRLNFGGEVVDSTTVELDPDEVETVELSAEATEDEVPNVIVSVSGQDPQLIEVQDISGAALSFDEQATASSTFTTEDPTTPGVVVEDIQEAEIGPDVADPSEDFVVLFEGDEVDPDNIIAFEPIDERNEDDSLVFDLSDVEVTPGEHTVEIHANENGAPDPTQPRGAAETATVFQGTLELDDQSSADAIEEGDVLAEVATADLLDGLGGETEFVVDVHPTDEDGTLVAPEFVGASDVLTGENENVEIVAERVPEDGEFNEFPITETDDYVAMVHIVDDDSEAGDPASPGEFPVLPNVDATDGPVPGGVTDDGEVAIDSFLEVSDIVPEEAVVDEGSDPIDVSATVTNTGDLEETQDVELTVTDTDGAVVFNETDEVTLVGGGTQDVTFEDVPAGALEVGEYTHAIASEDDAVAGSLTVAAEDEITATLPDESAVLGDEVTLELDVAATIGNPEQEVGSFLLELEFGDDIVAFEDATSDEFELTIEPSASEVAELGFDAPVTDDSGTVTILGVESGGVATPIDQAVEIDFDTVGEGETEVAFDENASEFATVDGEMLATDFQDGTVDVSDVDVPDFVVSDLDPEEAEVTEGDDPIDVSATVTNDGDAAGTQTIELLVEDETGAVVFDDTQELSLDPGDGETVTFEDVPAGDLEPGEYTHTVTSEDDAVSGDLTVLALESNFQVSDLDPEEAEVTEGSDPIDVSAAVTNVGTLDDEQTVTLTVEDEAGESVFTDDQDVSLDAGDDEEVVFEDVPAGTLDIGEYTHEIASEDDAVTGNLTVVEADVDLVGSLSSESGAVGETIQVELDYTAIGAEETLAGYNIQILFNDDALAFEGETDTGDFPPDVTNVVEPGVLNVLASDATGFETPLTPAGVLEFEVVGDEPSALEFNVNESTASDPDGNFFDVEYEDGAFTPADQFSATLDNVGASAWEITEQDSDDLGAIGEENPVLTFEEGTRYVLDNDGWDSHPLAFEDADGEALLSQDGDGTFEDDEQVHWVDNGDTVAFTVTEDLAAELDGYLCTVHGSMAGDIETVDEYGGETVESLSTQHGVPAAGL